MDIGFETTTQPVAAVSVGFPFVVFMIRININCAPGPLNSQQQLVRGPVGGFPDASMLHLESQMLAGKLRGGHVYSIRMFKLTWFWFVSAVFDHLFVCVPFLRG